MLQEEVDVGEKVVAGFGAGEPLGRLGVGHDRAGDDETMHDDVGARLTGLILGRQVRIVERGGGLDDRRAVIDRAAAVRLGDLEQLTDRVDRDVRGRDVRVDEGPDEVVEDAQGRGRTEGAVDEDGAEHRLDHVGHGLGRVEVEPVRLELLATLGARRFDLGPLGRLELVDVVLDVANRSAGQSRASTD